MKRALTHAALALSVANLVFVRRWYDLSVLQVPEVHYLKGSTSQGQELLWVVLAAIAALGALLWAAWRLAERRPLPRKLACTAFLLVLVIPFESVRRYWNLSNQRFDWAANLSAFAIEIVLLAGVVMMWRGSHRILRAARGAVLLSVALIPFVCGLFLLSFWKTRIEFASHPNLPIASGPEERRPRFLWLIMDEFDKHLAFEVNPPPVELPELRRLIVESLVADNAEQVQNYTLAAIPSLLTGVELAEVNAVDPNTLMVTPPGQGHGSDLREYPNVFRRAAKYGIDSAIAGWYHPYCRVLGDQVARCFAEAARQSPALQLASYARSHSWWRSILFLSGVQGEQVLSLATGEPLNGLLRLQSLEMQKEMQRQYFTIRDHAFQAAADPAIELGYFHFPTPHMLPIYNRRKRSFELEDSLNYFDNLALVDRTIGELRARLEAEGLWERTTLLITSDHGLRPGLWRGGIGWDSLTESLIAEQDPDDLSVPFILKVAGDAEAVKVDTPFSTLLSSDLALAVLTGEIKSNAQAAAWIRRRAETMHAGGSGSH
jgi:hypothetical protein